MNSQAINSASDRVEAFQTCIDEAKFTGLGCTSNCAPTYNMLAQSEEPTTVMFDNFGAGAEVAGAQPSTSKCTATSNWKHVHRNVKNKITLTCTFGNFLRIHEQNFLISFFYEIALWEHISSIILYFPV